MPLDTSLVLIAVLVLSAVMHEVAHGYAANFLGDPTARLAGRLTLNPIPHIDLFGSILLPGLLILSGSPLMFGYAKPVPYNPYNLKGRYGEAFVAAAGALSNIALAVLLGMLLRFGYGSFSVPFSDVLSLAVYINLMLALFNMIPLPPLDGSKVLSNLLPHRLSASYDHFTARFSGLGVFAGFALVMLLFWAFSPLFTLAIRSLYVLIVGSPLQL